MGIGRRTKWMVNMNNIKFLVFSLYNLHYKNGTNEHANPKNVIAVLVLYEIFFLVLLFAILDNLFNFSVLSTVKIIGTAVFVIPLYMLNYVYFIGKKGFERLYTQYHNAEINTKKNRVIAYIAIIVLFILLVTLISSIKYLLSYKVN